MKKLIVTASIAWVFYIAPIIGGGITPQSPPIFPPI